MDLRHDLGDASYFDLLWRCVNVTLACLRQGGLLQTAPVKGFWSSEDKCILNNCFALLVCLVCRCRQCARKGGISWTNNRAFCIVVFSPFLMISKRDSCCCIGELFFYVMALVRILHLSRGKDLPPWLVEKRICNQSSLEIS